MSKLRYALFLFAAIIILESCNNPGNVASENNSSYSRDTLRINTIIQSLEDGSYNNTDSALHDLEIAISLSAKIDYTEGLANLYFQKGNILYKQNMYQEAIDYYSKSIELSGTIDNILLKAKSLERMASVHLAADDPYHALKLYYESLPLFEKVKDKEGIAKVYNIIGIYKTDTQQYDSAEVYLQKAIKLNQEINNVRGINQSQGNLGYLFVLTGKKDSAEKIYLKLVTTLIELKDSLSLSVIYYDLCLLSQQQNDYLTSQDYLKKAIFISEKTKDTALLKVLYLSSGELYINVNKPDSATMTLNKSISYSQAINDAKTEMEALTLLAELNIASGDYLNGISKLHQVSILKDTLHLRKTKYNTKTSELQYENEKKKMQIELQQSSINSTRKTEKLYKVLWVISLSLVILFIIVLVLQMRHIRNRKEIFNKKLVINNLEIDRIQKEEEINKLKISKFTEELCVKEQELVNIALRIEQKNELLDQINKKITDTFKKETDSKYSTLLNELVTSINKKHGKQQDTDIFNQQFTSIHQGFFDNLKSKNPKLTKTDLKFCAYLRIHLSSSQIATILNVTNEAIRKTRYRIRKKINLSPKESLEDYISQY